MKEQKFGVITTLDGRVPTMAEAISADLETGSHHRNNAASKEFTEKYPTVLAVALVTDKILHGEFGYKMQVIVRPVCPKCHIATNEAYAHHPDLKCWNCGADMRVN